MELGVERGDGRVRDEPLLAATAHRASAHDRFWRHQAGGRDRRRRSHRLVISTESLLTCQTLAFPVKAFTAKIQKVAATDSAKEPSQESR